MALILNFLKCFKINCESCCPASNSFNFMDLSLILFSIGSFLVDIGTDIIVIIQYYKNEHFMWLILTTSLVCIPSFIVQIFSIRWYVIDEKATNSVWIFHILHLGLFYRFLQLLSEGFRIRKSKSISDLEKFNHQQSDICMLRLFESFMESAPQLVLQLYIMVSTDDWNPWTGVSAIASIVSLSWGIAAYSKAMRNVRPEKKSISWWGLLFQALWRIGMVSSRIVAMVLFAVAYGTWLIVAIGIHWLSMIVWVFIQNTDFCTTWWEEKLYNCVVGVIYCFCFFNLKEGRSRYRMGSYYFLTVLQNMAFVVAFYLSEKTSRSSHDLMAALVPVGMIIGLISMLLYYRFFHPSGPIFLFTGKMSQGKNDGKISDKIETNNCCTLKTCRKMTESIESKSENSTVSQRLHDETCIQTNLNLSKISFTSKDNNNVSKVYDPEKLLNCSVSSLDNDTSGSNSHSVSKTSAANHHGNVNYNFPPSAAFRSLSSKSYTCSFLVQDSDAVAETAVLGKEKLSKSLPNLEFSFESENSNSDGSIHVSNTMCEINSSSSGSEMYSLPVIDWGHIIRINVESSTFSELPNLTFDSA